MTAGGAVPGIAPSGKQKTDEVEADGGIPFQPRDIIVKILRLW